MSSPAATRLLVVGATGFIGRHAAERLAVAGFPVIGTSTGVGRADLTCDLRDPASVEAALDRAEPDAVLVAAGNSSVSSAWIDPETAFSANTAGPFNLLEAVRRLRPACRITLVSSAGVYGSPEADESPPFTETDPPRPASPYGTSKAAAEVLAGQYRRNYGLKVSVARLFNQIGPGQSDAQAPAEFAREIALAEDRGEDRLDLEIGNPESARDFTDVRDSAEALARIVAGEGDETFNICSGTTTTLADIADGLAAHTPLEVGVSRQPGKAHPADVSVVSGSAARIREATGWQPEIPLRTSLLDLLDDWRRRV